MREWLIINTLIKALLNCNNKFEYRRKEREMKMFRKRCAIKIVNYLRKSVLRRGKNREIRMKT